MSDVQLRTIFTPEQVGGLTYETPYFLFDKHELARSFAEYQYNFGAAEIYYAMKSNSEPEVLSTLHELGSGFEVASYYELDFLKELNVPAEKILFGTAVKPVNHIKKFVEYGVDRFAFDTEQELVKLAEHAPGARVYVRVLVQDNADSVFTMSEKFGTHTDSAADLMVKAKELGLIPYGLSFNVGSQARNADAWANGVKSLIPIIEELHSRDIQIEMINLGGGWPKSYIDGDGFPSVEEMALPTKDVLKQLPYPMKIFMEPGRGIVASSMALVVTVFAKNKRDNGHWLFVDAGAYNALLEAMSFQGDTRYRVSTVENYDGQPMEEFILTGPTGDSLDVINPNELLPSAVGIGDKLIIHDTAAYSTVLTTPFNGFPKPPVYTVGKLI